MPAWPFSSKYRLFLDDERLPAKKDTDMVVARSVSQACDCIATRGCPVFISFDHDLGDESNGTGYSFARWLVEQDLNAKGGFFPEGFSFTVHSQNPVGAVNIKAFLEGYLEFKSKNPVTP